MELGDIPGDCRGAQNYIHSQLEAGRATPPP